MHHIFYFKIEIQFFFFLKWRSNSCIGINSIALFFFLTFSSLIEKLTIFLAVYSLMIKLIELGSLGNTYAVRSPTQSVTYDTTLFVFVAQNNINYIICLFWKSVVGFLLKARTQKSEKWKTPWRRFEPWF